jgi:hypothetical protein
MYSKFNGLLQLVGFKTKVDPPFISEELDEEVKFKDDPPFISEELYDCPLFGSDPEKHLDSE